MPGAALGRELRVAGGRKPPSQVLEDVEGQAAHQGDDSDLPQERQGGNEVNICVEKGALSQNHRENLLGSRKAAPSTTAPSCPQHRGGTSSALSSLPTQAILGFYNS